MSKKTARKSMKLNISETKYKSLLRKRRSKKKNTSLSKSSLSKSSLSKSEKKQLNDALYIKYCKCLKIFESEGETRGYPICMNAVYKKRKIKPPKNASKKCKATFKVAK